MLVVCVKVCTFVRHVMWEECECVWLLLLHCTHNRIGKTSLSKEWEKRYIKVFFWECCDVTHRHFSIITAAVHACLIISKKKPQNRYPNKKKKVSGQEESNNITYYLSYRVSCCYTATLWETESKKKISGSIK